MLAGHAFSHYRVIGLLGAGGMSEVYKAEDTRLKRAVALKLLPPALVQDREAKQRLMAEAQAASALDHPNICTIYEIDQTEDGRLFLAMACYDGETLKQRIDRGPLPIDEALEVFVQVVRGVAAAHAAGIIHRDLKPANIFLCARSATRTAESGAAAARVPVDDVARVKLLDFGIAKLSGQTALTRTGTTVGTVAYMAPEHIAGHEIDQRADVWSLGVVLYEMLAGLRPFTGSHEIAVLKSISDDPPRPLHQVRPEVPAELSALVARALQKTPGNRIAGASELLRDLEAIRAARQPAAAASAPATPAARSRAKLWLSVGAALGAAAALGGWFTARTMRGREASRMALEIQNLVEREEGAQALRRLHDVPAALSESADIVRVRAEWFAPFELRTEPPGAEIAVKGYLEPGAEWIPLGQSPIVSRGTFGQFRFRIRKDGYETLDLSPPMDVLIGELTIPLASAGTIPAGMVVVPAGAVAAAGVGRVPEFFIDRYEVTNQEFKRFVDAGGYRRTEYWQEPFVREGRTLSWEAAMAEFRDATGRPGPATWELGTFPTGQADWPVGGVSWYEASAYARFAGKSLPSVHHWRRAAGFGIYSSILELSNFSGKSPARVGEHQGLGPYGTYDMAGNVKEWCVNAVGERRYILGGGWNEPNYQYRSSDARLPMDRSANNGLRLVSLTDPSAVPAAAFEPIAAFGRDYSKEKPVGDEVFAALSRVYAYDASDLKPLSESVVDAEAWRMERVSYTAAYGGERIVGYFFTPKNAAPPYQTIVYFPHGGSLVMKSFEQAEMAYLGFLIKSGRALLFPMYKGTYERRVQGPPAGPNALRDMMIQQIKDLGRSVDYLLTRPDVARDRLAFFGVSMGAAMAPIGLRVEPRFQAAVLWSGGFPLASRLPENDPINFAPRVTTPVLMLNGRDDFTFPVETSQEPLFRLLGTPAEHKRRALYDGGHVFPFSRMIKDSLDWYDRYLGAPR